MRIGVTGSSGFIGNALLERLCNTSMEAIPIILPRSPEALQPNFLNNLLATANLDAMIHTAAVRHPSTNHEIAFNAQLPALLQNSLAQVVPNARFVHLSSINVALSERTDPYSVTKRQAEDALADSGAVIIRPGIVWSWREDAGGDAGRLRDYLSRSLPFHPIPFPGQRYRPVDVEQLANRIADLLGEKKPPRVIHVNGDQSITIWQLAKYISKYTGSRLFPVPTEFLENILPKRILNYLPTAMRSTDGSLPNRNFGRPVEENWHLPFKLPT